MEDTIFYIVLLNVADLKIKIPMPENWYRVERFGIFFYDNKGLKAQRKQKQNPSEK